MWVTRTYEAAVSSHCSGRIAEYADPAVVRGAGMAKSDDGFRWEKVGQVRLRADP